MSFVRYHWLLQCFSNCSSGVITPTITMTVTSATRLRFLNPFREPKYGFLYFSLPNAASNAVTAHCSFLMHCLRKIEALELFQFADAAFPTNVISLPSFYVMVSCIVRQDGKLSPRQYLISVRCVRWNIVPILHLLHASWKPSHSSHAMLELENAYAFFKCTTRISRFIQGDYKCSSSHVRHFQNIIWLENGWSVQNLFSKIVFNLA